LKTFSEDDARSEGSGYLGLSSGAGNGLVDANRLTLVWILILAALFLSGAFVIIRDLRSLFRIRRSSYLVRSLGKVRIYANQNTFVPFSFWLPNQANIVVPSGMIAKPDDYKMTINHELQHHRQGDTRWVYVVWGLRLMCLINPFIHLWSRWISEIQEFACDETLVDQKKVDSRDYARCLVEVAQHALCQKEGPVCATGVIFLVERPILKRRIQKMMTRKVAS